MLRTGFARNVITPPRGTPLCGYFSPRPCTGVLDDLSVKAAVLEMDGVKAALVAYDLISPGGELLEMVLDSLEKAGISWRDNIIFCAVHTHTAPYPSRFFGYPAERDYLETVAEKTLDAILTAARNLSETELFTGTAFCDTLAFNRRFWMKDGSVLTNPGKRNPDIVRPEGPVDGEIPVAVFKKDGAPSLILANIVNHADTIGGSRVPADWPGRMERAIQNAMGYDIPVITVLGCSGNINHLDIASADPQCSYAEACRIGQGYADVLLRALGNLQKVSVGSFQVESRTVRIPFRRITPEECAEARNVLEKTSASPDGDTMTAAGLADGNGTVARFFAEQLLAYARNSAGTVREYRMLSMKFGSDFALVSMPGEVFTEVGLAIRKASGFPRTMVLELAMGDCGYVPLPECFGRGGYETLPVEEGGVSPETAGLLRETALSLLNG